LRQRKDTKYQKASRQIALKREESVRLVSMPAEKDEPADVNNAAVKEGGQ
jgi:NADH-quinone oxidoreductase subunit J